MPVELNLSPPICRNLPNGGAAFLTDVADALDAEHVQSVVLFGSVVVGEATEHSDVDIVVVLDDDAPDAYAESIQSRCAKLAEQHLGISTYASDPVGRVVDRQTGMFRSGFVTRERDVRAGNFSVIFNTSRVADLLAPWRSVLAGVFETAEPIYGPAVEPAWTDILHPMKRSGRELFRDWLMTVLLAAFQPIYVLVSPRAMHYSMEAYKWTAYTCAYHVTGSPARSLADALDAVPSIPAYDRWFRSLRDTPRTTLTFILVTPLIVTFVHVAAFIRVFAARNQTAPSR